MNFTVLCCTILSTNTDFWEDSNNFVQCNVLILSSPQLYDFSIAAQIFLYFKLCANLGATVEEILETILRIFFLKNWFIIIMHNCWNSIIIHSCNCNSIGKSIYKISLWGAHFLWFGLAKNFFLAKEKILRCKIYPISYII